MKNMIDFTNKFQLSKTLRFELRPVGKTLENIKKKGLITKDQERAVSYQKMKKTIDGFHKYFIELAMRDTKIYGLNEFAEMYHATPERKKEESFKKKFAKKQEELRKQIAKGFNTGEAKEIYAKIDKKELITELLVDWKKTQQSEDIYFDEKFKGFTTYFGGFHENRKNMYTDKEQSTAIAYRLIHENLPKFLDNIKTFEKLIEIEQLQENCKTLYKEIEEYLNINSIDEAFSLSYFNDVLSQNGITVYNLIVGGRATEGKKKIQGLNEYINLYNQKQEKKNRLPKLKPLYKQILSDRIGVSFMQEKFEESQDVLNAIENYYKANLVDFEVEGKNETENTLLELQKLLASIPDESAFNTSKIYIRNDKALTDISNAIFNDWGLIKAALEFKFLQSIVIGKKGITNKQEKEKEQFLKQPHFSIAEIEDALLLYKNEVEKLHDLTPETKPLTNYFTTHFKALKKEGSEKEVDFITNITAKYSCIKGILNTDYPEGKNLHQDQKTIDNIKVFLDSLMELLHFVKPLALPKDSTLEKDENFYSHFESYYDQLDLLVPLYNKVRNYATQKPYSIEKFKFNFENAQLLNGWDANKERDYLTSILRKDGNYFLAVMDKNHNKVFQNIDEHTKGESFEKLIYKLLPGVNKMLPKVFFSNKNIDYFAPSNELLDKYKLGTHKKGEYFSLKDCHNLIDFFKSSINKHESWKNFDFKFSPTSSYEDLSDFYKEVADQGYKLNFQKVSVDFIHELIEDGKLYLFQIYNKDFSPHSKGKPNMHTLYWKALFDEENLKDVVYKLNGQAEMFYRKKSIDKPTVHAANEPIENKNPKAEKKTSTFEYDIVKDKRFTVDKFQFHVPITMNYKARGTDFINNDVLDYLKNNPDVNIIGIDRGERHLIYITVIDQQGNIKIDEDGNPMQYSLNDIVSKYKGANGKMVEKLTPYHTLLHNKEKERDEARKNWGTIETIKELKEGYISQVVHIITKLMVQHNAIVVMEDLNFGFKRGRFKVEKQVYQKLEKMLIDKLNYLVLKDKLPSQPAGIYKALQLTNKFKSFKDLGKQSGFLFYVPAWNTSKIDPTTGFVNLFYTKYESVPKAHTFFSQFDSIRYNTAEKHFEFTFDYINFTKRAEGTRTQWSICTQGDRILTFRNPKQNNQWDNKKVNLTQQFEDFFGSNAITYGDGNDLKNQILSKNEKAFFEKLLHLFKLTLQMRNSITNSTNPEDDYLISPVKNNTGEFYDSRKAPAALPQDADANGAYHIAKKGLWALQTINQHNDEWKKIKLAISNKDWLNFVQSNAL